MSSKDPRVDAYIAKSPDFAKPILTHLRELAHAACPDVEETLKWQMPFFLHKGILFGMASFKAHCTLHFWNGKLFWAKLPASAVWANSDALPHYRICPIEKHCWAISKKRLN